MTLTPLNRRAENVIVEAVVISELKFSDIQRHIFCTDHVERADDTALEDAAEVHDYGSQGMGSHREPGAEIT
jgi:hypothetical protein